MITTLNSGPGYTTGRRQGGTTPISIRKDSKYLNPDGTISSGPRMRQEGDEIGGVGVSLGKVVNPNVLSAGLANMQTQATRSNPTNDIPNINVDALSKALVGMNTDYNTWNSMNSNNVNNEAIANTNNGAYANPQNTTASYTLNPTADNTISNIQYNGDVTDLYNQAANSQIDALNQATAQTLNQLLNQQKQLPQQYDPLRSQAYTNSRLSAIGNNEILAAQGLSGALNANPTSGTSETSRINQNVALGNAINGLNLQQQNAKNDINNQIANVQSQAAQQAAQIKANVAQQLAQALMQQDQNDKQFSLQEANLTGEYNGNPTMEKQQLSQQDTEKNLNRQIDTLGQYYDDFQAEIDMRKKINPNDPLIPYLEKARAQKVQDAWDQYYKQGVVTSDIAPIINLPVGTKTPEAKTKADTEAQKLKEAQDKIAYNRAWDKWTKNAPLTDAEWQILGIPKNTRYIPPKNTSPIQKSTPNNNGYGLNW